MEKQKPAKPAITAFKQDLTHILNLYGFDNWADTPDFILADFLYGQLCGFHHARLRSVKHAKGGPFESKESFDERRKRVAANYASSDTKGPGRPPFTDEARESILASLKGVFEIMGRVRELKEELIKKRDSDLREPVKRPVPVIERGLQFTWKGVDGICEVVHVTDKGNRVTLKIPAGDGLDTVLEGYGINCIKDSFERGVFIPVKKPTPSAAFPFGGPAPKVGIYEVIAGNYQGEPSPCMCIACVLEREYEAAAAQGLTGKVQTDAERRRSQQNAR